MPGTAITDFWLKGWSGGGGGGGSTAQVVHAKSSSIPFFGMVLPIVALWFIHDVVLGLIFGVVYFVLLPHARNALFKQQFDPTQPRSVCTKCGVTTNRFHILPDGTPLCIDKCLYDGVIRRRT